MNKTNILQTQVLAAYNSSLVCCLSILTARSQAGLLNLALSHAHFQSL